MLVTRDHGIISHRMRRWGWGQQENVFLSVSCLARDSFRSCTRSGSLHAKPGLEHHTERCHSMTSAQLSKGFSPIRRTERLYIQSGCNLSPLLHELVEVVQHIHIKDYLDGWTHLRLEGQRSPEKIVSPPVLCLMLICFFPARFCIPTPASSIASKRLHN